MLSLANVFISSGYNIYASYTVLSGCGVNYSMYFILFKYLGDRVSAGGGCEAAVTARTACG